MKSITHIDALLLTLLNAAHLPDVDLSNTLLQKFGYKVSANNLHAALKKLLEYGFIFAYSPHPACKIFSITPFGQQSLNDYWQYVEPDIQLHSAALYYMSKQYFLTMASQLEERIRRLDNPQEMVTLGIELNYARLAINLIDKHAECNTRHSNGCDMSVH